METFDNIQSHLQSHDLSHSQGLDAEQTAAVVAAHAHALAQAEAQAQAAHAQAVEQHARQVHGDQEAHNAHLVQATAHYHQFHDPRLHLSGAGAGAPPAAPSADGLPPGAYDLLDVGRGEDEEDDHLEINSDLNHNSKRSRLDKDDGRSRRENLTLAKKLALINDRESDAKKFTYAVLGAKYGVTREGARKVVRQGDQLRESAIDGSSLTRKKSKPVNKSYTNAPLQVAISLVGNEPPPRIRIILGTMLFGGDLNKEDALEMMDCFILEYKNKARWSVELDSARMYCGGRTELLLGELLAERHEFRARVCVSSKANPFEGYQQNLRPESVLRQCEESLAALRLPSLDIFYLHAPDAHTPIEHTLAAAQSLYEQGKFRELGLSNFPAWQVAYCHGYCARRGWVKPTVYQGMYNALTRDLERELLPCLRHLGMRLYAYNPLAGGILTGKHQYAQDPMDGRFKDNEVYQHRYWHPRVFAALERVRAQATLSGIGMAAAALRWLTHHSQLRADESDGIIVGASNITQFRANMRALGDGPLPPDMVMAYEQAWLESRADCPSYFR